MARFNYLGEPARSYVLTHGPTQLIRLPKKDGTTEELTPISPADRFLPNQDIGYDITDERSLRAIRADSRFEEII